MYLENKKNQQISEKCIGIRKAKKINQGICQIVACKIGSRVYRESGWLRGNFLVFMSIMDKF